MLRVTLANVQSLIPGNAIHFPRENQSCERWKVSGQVKLWKTDRRRVRVPLKHGLHSYGAITESDFHSTGIPYDSKMKNGCIVKPGVSCAHCGLDY